MSENPEQENPWTRALQWVRQQLGGATDSAEPDGSMEETIPVAQSNPCCSPKVHIAYRGKSDDRMYVAYNRDWSEVRFYQPNGLRVFCAECRRRVY